LTVPAIFPSSPKLKVEGLGLRFPDAPAKLFEGLSFELKSGDLLVITGANSSGKSSLIKCLCGIIPKSITACIEGRIMLGFTNLDVIPLCEIYRFISVALADTRDQILMPTLELEIAFALENMGLDMLEIRRKVEQSAARFGLSHLLQEAPQKLSGGEQRKLLFAICDSMQSSILMMDEPETGLSNASMETLCNWLNEKREAGKGIVLATHDARLIKMADTIICLDKSDV